MSDTKVKNKQETRPIEDCTGQWTLSGVIGWWVTHPNGGSKVCPVHKDDPTLVKSTVTPPTAPYVVPKQILKPEVEKKMRGAQKGTQSQSKKSVVVKKSVVKDVAWKEGDEQDHEKLGKVADESTAKSLSKLKKGGKKK